MSSLRTVARLVRADPTPEALGRLADIQHAGFGRRLADIGRDIIVGSLVAAGEVGVETISRCRGKRNVWRFPALADGWVRPDGEGLAFGTA